MPRVVITQAVEDVARRLQSNGERAVAIRSAGGTNVTDHVAQDGTNDVAVTADVADVASFEGVLTSPPPEVLALMQAHGVVQPISLHVET